MRPLLLTGAVLGLLALPTPSGAQTDSTIADSTAADSTAADSLTADPVTAWSRWPDIGPAVVLGPLDGPQDILEKEEIIADRIDDLVAEDVRLDTLDRAWGARHLAMSTQLEVLDDLAEVQLGGDLEFQQRVESVREDVLQAVGEVARIDSSRLRLAARVAGLRALSRDYEARVTRLRQEESQR